MLEQVWKAGRTSSKSHGFCNSYISCLVNSCGWLCCAATALGIPPQNLFRSKKPDKYHLRHLPLSTSLYAQSSPIFFKLVCFQSNIFINSTEAISEWLPRNLTNWKYSYPQNDLDSLNEWGSQSQKLGMLVWSVGWLNQQTLTCHDSGGWMLAIRVPVWSSSWWRSPSWLCPHMAFRWCVQLKRKRFHVSSSFYKGTNPHEVPTLLS